MWFCIALSAGSNPDSITSIVELKNDRLLAGSVCLLAGLYLDAPKE